MNNSKSKNTGPWIPNNQSIEIYILKDDKYALHAFADATEKVLEGLEVLQIVQENFSRLRNCKS